MTWLSLWECACIRTDGPVLVGLAVCNRINLISAHNENPALFGPKAINRSAKHGELERLGSQKARYGKGGVPTIAKVCHIIDPDLILRAVVENVLVSGEAFEHPEVCSCSQER